MIENIDTFTPTFLTIDEINEIFTNVKSREDMYEYQGRIMSSVEGVVNTFLLYYPFARMYIRSPFWIYDNKEVIEKLMTNGDISNRKYWYVVFTNHIKCLQVIIDKSIQMNNNGIYDSSNELMGMLMDFNKNVLGFQNY